MSLVNVAVQKITMAQTVPHSAWKGMMTRGTTHVTVMGALCVSWAIRIL